MIMLDKIMMDSFTEVDVSAFNLKIIENCTPDEPAELIEIGLCDDQLNHLCTELSRFSFNRRNADNTKNQLYLAYETFRDFFQSKELQIFREWVADVAGREDQIKHLMK